MSRPFAGARAGTLLAATPESVGAGDPILDDPRFLRLVIDSMPGAVVVADPGGRMVLFNAAAERLVGQGPTSASPESWQAQYGVFHPDGETPVAVEDLPLVQALAGKHVTAIGQLVRNPNVPDGVHLSVSAAPICDGDGKPRGAVAVFYDVGDKMRAQLELARTAQQLHRAQKMEAIGRLAGCVAHDFNNCLAVIMAYAGILASELDAADPRREDVLEIHRAGERATSLTRQLLALSHRPLMEPHVIALNDVVTGVEKMLQRLLGAEIELKLYLAADAGTVCADPGGIEQVIINLVLNARDAMPAGGKLTIETRRVELDEDYVKHHHGVAAGPHVILAVSDTGTGMDSATRERIFEPFFTTKREGRGTGLGLASVYGIAQQVGGHVQVYSELGIGSSFRVYLPSSDAPSAEQRAAKLELAPLSRAVATILVVDDDEAVRRAAGRILRHHGHSVIEADGGDAARRIAIEHDERIDLLLSDVIMPGGSGREVAAELIALRPEMRVLFMSGYPGGALAHRGVHAPSLVSKPFTPTSLAHAVATVLGTSAENGFSRGALASASEPPRVLLVDDEELTRRSLAALLTRGGFQVVQASGGREAIALAANTRFDAVVSDVRMPDMDGIALLRSLRGIDLDVAVVLMTGAPDAASAASAIEHGVFRYLEKPVAPQVLTQTIQKALRHGRLARVRRAAVAALGVHRTAAIDRAGLEVRFERALERLVVVYQPIVRASDRMIFGYEALMRTGESSMPDPGSVLDAAERLGRIVELGRIVRAQAAASMPAACADAVLFVNLHAEELADAELLNPDGPLGAIAGRVVLEVTERAALDQSVRVEERVARLRDLGYRVAVDDMGAGYAGLTTYVRLEPEIVKLDMSLVRNVHASAVRQKTVGSLVALCHDMDKLVVGEGVETESERDCLVSLGCDLLQGYLFARPGPAFPAVLA